MRTTITLDDDVFEAVRTQAVASGMPFGKVLSELARRSLRAAPQPARRRGLPVFKVAAKSAIIPSDRAGELLAEDLP